MKISDFKNRDTAFILTTYLHKNKIVDAEILEVQLVSVGRSHVYIMDGAKKRGFAQYGENSLKGSYGSYRPCPAYMFLTRKEAETAKEQHKKEVEAALKSKAECTAPCARIPVNNGCTLEVSFDAHNNLVCTDLDENNQVWRRDSFNEGEVVMALNLLRYMRDAGMKEAYLLDPTGKELLYGPIKSGLVESFQIFQ